MSNISDCRETCCGCGACAQVCPVNCISMESDAEGFLYPAVDENACISCGRCRTVCPVLRTNWENESGVTVFQEPEAYGGYIKDPDILADSSSGGAFTLFAEKIINEGGVVYGAAFDKDNTVSHTAVCDTGELTRLRGSKYVQSDLKRVYTEIRDCLKSGKKVLFVGTPCQTAGLKAFVGDSGNNLYLVDFICHGVPSPGVLKAYIDSLESKEGSRVIGFRFRMKDKGWNSSGLQLGTQISFENGTVIRNYPALKDTYMNGFLEDIVLRRSCYNCSFKTIPKYTADITIADFWGVSKALPSIKNIKGTSLVLIHNDKGRELFDCVKENMEYSRCPDWNDSVKKNQTLLKSANYRTERDDFFHLMHTKGYDYAAKKYFSFGRTFRNKAGRIIWGKFEQVVLAVLKKVFSALKIEFTPKKQESFLQFFKFCLIGVSNACVSYLVNILTLKIISLVAGNVPFDYVIGNIVAFIVAVYWSYCWNSRKVFNIDRSDARFRRKVLIRTYASYAFSGLLLNNVLSTFWIQVLGVSKYVSPLLNLFITVPVNFLTNKYWAYAKER